MLMARILPDASTRCCSRVDAGIEPDPWQAELLRERPKRALLCCARQTGKTEAFNHPGGMDSALEARALGFDRLAFQRQSGEMFRRLMLAHSRSRACRS